MKRPDGRLVKGIEPMQRITPYIMKTRNDAMNMFEDSFACDAMDAYIQEKAEQGIKMNYMTIMIAAVVRLIALRPQLNRFVINKRIYARHKIWVSFSIHHTLREDDPGTDLKLCFEGTETILEIADKVNKAIEAETIHYKDTQANDLDKFLDNLMNHLPSWVLAGIINTLMWMDKHNLMPKAIVELSPFHTSFFLTNLKSLGINHVFHHVYNFGTTGLFIAIGKEKMVPIVEKKKLVTKKHMGFGLVADERFCDGLYFALSLRQLKKFLMDPKQLETPLEKKVEDVD